MPHRRQAVVRQRAAEHCEYCRLPEAVVATPFAVDHIIARQHGGRDDDENLAWACYRCNLHKGPNVAGYDAQGNGPIRLFHPRRDRWSEHFRWTGPHLTGLTAIGQVTIQVLAINDAGPVALRLSLIEERLFPPSA